MSLVRKILDHPIIRQQGKFLTVGLLCTVLDFGIFNAIAYWVLDWDPVAANAVSFLLTVAVSFMLNRTWTFEKLGKVDLMKELVPFLIISAIGLACQTAAIWASKTYLSENILVVNAAKVAGVGAIWFAKFYIYRNFVFVTDRTRADQEALTIPG